MSWKQAQEEADRWVSKLQLRNADIKGKVVDLRPHASTLAVEGQFRTMVLEAAKRLLKKRGATDVIVEFDLRTGWER